MMPVLTPMPLRALRQRGVAAVELALLLPMLVVLMLCAIDGARALQANIIMTNIGREGANLAARGGYDLDTDSQTIISAVMATAPPLNVNKQGMMYITRVMGSGSGSAARNVVLDQYRWDDGASAGFTASKYAPTSRVYTCTSWKTSKCSNISSVVRPTAPVMTGKLDDGEVIFVVETFYRFDMMVSSFSLGASTLPTFGPDLYSMTIF